MAGHVGQPFVEFFAQAADLRGILRDVLALPTVSHREQQRDQGGGRGQNHALSGARFDQRRIFFESGAEEAFAGQEENHKLRRGVELLPILLAGERGDVRAHLARVILQERGAGIVVGGLAGGQVGFERRLGVHHDVLAARQPDQQVGPQSTLLRGGDGLGVEVAVLQHACQLDHAFELNFAPSAAHAGRAQGGGQPAGFGAELGLAIEQRADLLDQSRIGPGAGGLQVLNLAVDFFQRFADRPHQVGDSLLPQIQIAAGGFVSMFQARLGQVQKRLVVAL